jgi:hypothetical protein
MEECEGSIVVVSTMKVEFMACFEAATQENWLWNFFSRFKIVDGITKPLKFIMIIPQLSFL